MVLHYFFHVFECGQCKTQTADWGELAGLNPVSGVYRSLEPLLLQLASLYININATQPCLHWFNDEVNLFHVAVGTDGAPFGKDEKVTAYLVNFLNLLERVSSCEDNLLSWVQTVKKMIQL